MTQQGKDRRHRTIQVAENLISILREKIYDACDLEIDPIITAERAASAQVIAQKLDRLLGNFKEDLLTEDYLISQERL